MKRYILKESDLKVYNAWFEDRLNYIDIYGTDDLKDWEQQHPCPLPPMINIPSDSDIEIYNGVGVIVTIEETNAWINGAKWLKTLLGI